MDNNQQTLNNSSESSAAPVQEQQKTPQSGNKGGLDTEAQKTAQQGGANQTNYISAGVSGFRFDRRSQDRRNSGYS